MVVLLGVLLFESELRMIQASIVSIAFFIFVAYLVTIFLKHKQAQAKTKGEKVEKVIVDSSDTKS